MAIFCSNCGTQNADNATFCTNCGKAISQPVIAATPAGTGPVITTSTAPAGALPNENVMGGIAYLTFIPAIILLLIEPYNRNRFVRFHAWQEIWLSVARIVIWIATFWIPFSGFGIGFALRSLIGLLFFVAWLIAIINAFQGKMFKLPIIGDLAESQANKM
jgi:uncharacterized membrane protein